MATVRGRPAHAPGPTYLSYTPNGRNLVTTGMNSAFRVFKHKSEDEPGIIDVLTDSHLAVVASNDFVIVGAEDGSVTKYSLSTLELIEVLTRCATPIRDLALSADRQWVAVVSEEQQVKIVNTMDMSRVMTIRDLSSQAKHASFDLSGSRLAISCCGGAIYIYALSTEEPRLIKQIDGVIKRQHSDAEASTKVHWHPDGQSISVPNIGQAIESIATSDWKARTSFIGHSAEITTSAWSPNGALLATAGLDKQLIIYETRSQTIIRKLDDIQHTILQLQWHPVDNVLSYTNNQGELFVRENIVPQSHTKLLEIDLEPSPMAPALREISGNASRPIINGKGHDRMRDSGFGDFPDGVSMDDGFIEDDDGAGYAEVVNQHGKRTAQHIPSIPSKRQELDQQADWYPEYHEAFQPGSTPWKGDRRYLCLNFIGCVWTVNQETHNTITVEFYDRQMQRDFHFTDPYQYDKACLHAKGSLFSSPAHRDRPATLHYRPHETWTTRNDWRSSLPAGEEVTSMSLSDSCIVIMTSAGYVRVYSLFGLPLRIYRQKSLPAVTCASWRDYIMTVGNGPVSADGHASLHYSIENVKRNETYQSEDVLPLPPGAKPISIFFSNEGDPCMYDSEGVLLVLEHWRVTGQAKWVPLLDTKNLARLANGRKDEKYWPVAVANNKFHCIILKGGEEYPYFPRPLLSDFDFEIPITTRIDDDDEQHEQHKLEEQHAQFALRHSLLQHMVENTDATSAQKAQLSVLEREIDKALLQMIASECREGEERGMKALELAGLMRDRTGKMLEAAGKIAARFQRDILGEKITDLAERRLVGLVADDAD